MSESALTEIEIWDLKSGSGPTTKLGDTVELRYHVAASLELLDTGMWLQSNWSPGDAPIYATLGAGQLRAAIEAALVGVRVGTNRRFLIPAHTWADVTVPLAIGVDVGAIVPTPPHRAADWDFDEMASAVPLDALGTIAELDRQVHVLLSDAVSSGRAKRRSQNALVRLVVTPDLFSHMQTLLHQRGVAAKLRYGLREVGTVSGGDYEVELAREDLETWLALARAAEKQS